MYYLLLVVFVLPQASRWAVFAQTIVNAHRGAIIIQPIEILSNVIVNTENLSKLELRLGSRTKCRTGSMLETKIREIKKNT